jgi:hypothetical protein
MAIDIQAGSDVIERVLEAPGALVWLDTDDAEGLVAQFSTIARRTGQSMYRWRPEDGLVGLRDAQMRVPGCPRVGDALRYVLQSLHFGIYLVTPPALVGAQDTHLLRQIARSPSEPVRRVVLLGASPSLGEALEDVLTRIVARQRTMGLRLRDGRWVV